MAALFDNIVIVTRKTELDELVARFNTKAQAKFYLEQSGHSFSPIQAAHDKHHNVLKLVRETIPTNTKHQIIDRDIVPRFTFGDDDLVITIGQDGLVSNTAKYLHGQLILAVNPDPSRFDGILLPFDPGNFAPSLTKALAGDVRTKAVTLARAETSNNQSLLAFNDFFIGAKSHVSARYSIEVAGQKENQSSSGIIVSTGAGSSGWLQSVYAGAAGVIEALGGKVTPPPENGRLAWDTKSLAYSVREPFPSQVTQCSLVHGLFSNEMPLKVTSKMSSNGVIFSDGVESDFLDFNSGTELTISTAPQQAHLIVP